MIAALRVRFSLAFFDIDKLILARISLSLLWPAPSGLLALGTSLSHNDIVIRAQLGFLQYNNVN